VSRKSNVDALYDELSLLVRRSREFYGSLHGGLSLVNFTLLSSVKATPGTRAADLTMRFGLDKSTLSRQVNKLIDEDLLERTGERAGRRGVVLELTPSGEGALAAASDAVRSALGKWLDEWSDAEIANFTQMFARLNESVPKDPAFAGSEIASSR
jgi:DNA-binding MarR family transcriptional regulator